MVSTHQRFEAVTFDYGSLDEWRSYFEEIREIAKSCKVIEEFWNELKRKCDGLTFKDGQEEFDYSTVLLGGVTPKGEYKERSLAKVYAVLFGFKLEIYDLIERLRRDLPPTTKVTVKETGFIHFVRRVSDKVISILRQAESKGLIDSADVDVEVDYYGILSDYKKLIEILENFVNNVAKILPNYNQKSLFVWTLDKLTYRYMTTAYPKLRDEKVFELIKDVLGLEVIFSPDVEDDKTKREYEVYSNYDGSIGKELIELFKTIWDAFDYSEIEEILSDLFRNLPSFKEEFCESAIKSLERVNWIFLKEFTNVFLIRRINYKVSGVAVIDTEKGESFSLLEMLDELSAGSFLLCGLVFDFRITKDTLEIFPVYNPFEKIRLRILPRYSPKIQWNISKEIDFLETQWKMGQKMHPQIEKTLNRLKEFGIHNRIIGKIKKLFK
jgi:hypothetical protein